MDLKKLTVHGLDLTGQINLIKSSGHVLHERIGTGGSTDVFKGEWKNGSTRPVLVAVKTWRFTDEMNSEAVDDLNRRLVRESELWNKLKHINVLPYHGYCSGLCRTYALISPLCEKGTIMSYLSRNPGVDRLKLLLDVLAGLEYLHGTKKEGVIVHGDLSSKNVLINGHHNACLCDFGRAKIVGEPQYATALVIGSLPYMAPELLPEDDGDIDNLFTVHSDIYAFGMVAFEVLAGRLPLEYSVGNFGKLLKFAHSEKEVARPTDEGRITTTLWGMMQECWTKESMRRPPAQTLAERVRREEK